MVIKNRSFLGGEEVLSTLLKNSKKAYISKFMFGFVMMIIGIIITFLAYLSSGVDSIVMGAMFLGIGILYLMVTLLSYFRLPNNLRKSNADLVNNGMTNQFTFKEESFFLISDCVNHAKKYELRYDMLYKIIEMDNEIIFMLNKTEIFICKKDGFNTPKEMEVFFYGLSKHKIKIKNQKTKEETMKD